MGGSEVGMRRDWVCGLLVGLVAVSPACSQTGESDRAELKWAFSYDEAGRLTSVVDPGGNGVSTEFIEGDTGRLERVVRSHSDGTITRTELDEFGRVVRMADPNGATSYAYTPFDRLARVERDGFPEVSYGYDAEGRIRFIRVEANEFLYSYDFLGRLVRIDTPAGPFTYAYDTLRNTVARTYPNGLRAVVRFAPDGKRQSITHVGPDGGVLRRLSYEYSPGGLIRRVVETTPGAERSTSFHYDAERRLARVERSPEDGTVRYRYDSLGNRTLESGPGQPVQAEYDWAGRARSYGGEAVAHDPAGNVVRYSRRRRPVDAEYDAAGRVVTATVDGRRTTYEYDGAGYLVARSSRDQKVRFLVPDPRTDAWQPLLSVDEAGRETLFLWEGDELLATIHGEESRFYLHDHLGSVRSEFDAAGTPLADIDYDPFGGVGSPRPAGLQPRFAGLFLDTETGLYITAARAYDPAWGRFLQIDPEFRVLFGGPNDLSPYVYAGNDPVNYVDRTGFDRECVHAACVSGPDLIRDNYQALHTTRTRQKLRELRDRAYQNARDQLTKPLGDAIGSLQGPNLFSDRFGYGQWVSDAFVAGAKNVVTGQANRALERAFEGEKPESGDQAERLLRDLKESVTSGNLKTNILTQKTVKDLRISNGRDVLGELLRRLDRFGAVAAKRAHYMKRLQLRPTPVRPPRVRYRPGGGLRDHRYRNYVRLGSRYDQLASVRHRAGLNRARSVRVAGRTANGLLATLSAVDVAGQALGEIGRSMQLGSQPLAQRRVSGGWHGVDTFEGPSGTVGYREEIRIRPRGFTDPGHFTREHNSVIVSRDGEGRYETSRTETTPFTSLMEMFMFNRFPLTDYFDPEKSHIETTRHSHESYRVQTRRGVTDVTGLIGTRRAEPTRVGGVYLGNAGEVLGDLGEIVGVSIDEATGRFALVSREGELPLPRFRLADMVTVFRCVYGSGEAPFVSIDPNPENPRGEWMNVRHSPCTEGTYVGWVAFEADRIMKNYSLGIDAVSDTEVQSSVPGYRGLLTLGLEGDAAGRTLWERFWILPRQVHRDRSPDNDLTLLEVPMRVETERMKRVKGAFVPAANQEGWTPGVSFADWFSKHYDEIAAEVSSTPPEGCIDAEEIPVFSELRRIATVVAIAEDLRDRGVPFPSWMDGHDVASCVVPEQTPAVTVEGERSGRVRSVYGGVEFRAKVVPETIVAPELGAVARFAREELDAKPLLTNVELEHEGEVLRAAELPGEQTSDVGAAQITEIDLAVRLESGETLSLARTHHSFFRPSGALGRAWSLDLPRLEAEQRVVSRTEKVVTKRMLYRLTSPFGSASATFAARGSVPELGGTFLRPRTVGPFLALGRASKEGFEGVLAVVFLRDGRRWYFDASGRLVATLEGDSLVRYRRDSDERIVAIEAHRGERELGTIELEYDAVGRVARARSSGGDSVRYHFDADGLLAVVAGPRGRTAYAYRDGLVAGILRESGGLQLFGYDERGRLVEELRPDGERVVHAFTEEDGEKVWQATSPTRGERERVEYGPNGRPARHETPDGLQIRWQYPRPGQELATIASPEREHLEHRRSPEGSVSRYSTATRGTLVVERDAEGRTTRIERDGVPVLEQEWLGDGRLRGASTPLARVVPHYDARGRLTQWLVGPAHAGATLRRWLGISVDESGRVRRIENEYGEVSALGYDEEDRVESLSTPSGSTRLERDEHGCIEAVESSWGEARRIAFIPGTCTPREIELRREGKSARVALDEGRVVAFEDWNGAETRAAFSEVTESLSVVIETPSGLVIAQEFDEDGALARVKVGDVAVVEYRYDDEGRVSSLISREADPPHDR